MVVLVALGSALAYAVASVLQQYAAVRAFEGSTPVKAQAAVSAAAAATATSDDLLSYTLKNFAPQQ